MIMLKDLRTEGLFVWYYNNMKLHNKFLLFIKIFTVAILIAYAIGFFRTYDTFHAIVMLVIAILFSLEVFTLTKEESK